MALTPRLRWPYPDDKQRSWYDIFESMIAAADASCYALREVQNLLVMGGGNVSFATTNLSHSLLSWDAPIELSASITGFLWRILPGSVDMADGDHLYVRLDRAPTQHLTAVFEVSNQLPNTDDYLLFGIRRGEFVYFRAGGAITNGQTIRIFEAGSGGGGAVPWSIQAPPVVTIGGAGATGAVSRAAREDHDHGIVVGTSATTLVPGTAAAGGNVAAVSRSDHRHALPTADLGDIKAVTLDGNNATGVVDKVARADHEHALLAAAPSTVGTANAEGVSTSVARADHIHRTQLEIQKNGIPLTTRPKINFTAPNITVTDDEAGDRALIDFTTIGAIGNKFTSWLTMMAYPILIANNAPQILGIVSVHPDELQIAGTTLSINLELIYKISAAGGSSLVEFVVLADGVNPEEVVASATINTSGAPTELTLDVTALPRSGLYELRVTHTLTNMAVLTVYNAQLRVTNEIA